MRRLLLLTCAVGAACADAGVVAPVVDGPQFAESHFSQADLAGVKARLGPAQHSTDHFVEERTFSACTPTIQVRFFAETDVRTQTWSGYDPSTGVTELYAVDHYQSYRSYTNLDSGKTIEGHQGYAMAVYIRINDALTVSETRTWQSGNVLSVVSVGEGRVRYKSGHQVITTDWTQSPPLREITFVGTQDSSFCSGLMGEPQGG